jgi:hypothetical protein
MRSLLLSIPVLLVFALLLAACGQEAGSPALPEGESEPAGIEPGGPEAAEEPTYTWNQLLDRDSIRPIYNPEFVPADQAGYTDDELVMGVAIDGQAKAYPVGPLNSREMVNDELAGIPILVTW